LVNGTKKDLTNERAMSEKQGRRKIGRKRRVQGGTMTNLKKGKLSPLSLRSSRVTGRKTKVARPNFRVTDEGGGS